MPNNWHLVHLGGFATRGYGMLLTEATAVSPEGRISRLDTGLWSDEQVPAWHRITDFTHSQGSAIGVQLSHAGRKGSAHSLWTGIRGSVSVDHGGWITSSSTRRPFGAYASPLAMSLAEIDEIPRQFASAAARAYRAGFDAIEIHAAHGYLLHQFLSPVINDRSDAYGGGFEQRVRLLLEVVEHTRDTWPSDLPLVVRLSATDWIESGWDLEQTVRAAKLLQDRGVDALDISSGGAVAEAQIAVRPGYQVPFAKEVKSHVDIPVGVVGLITEPTQAQGYIDDGSADFVLLGRAALRDPAWPQRAAHALGIEGRPDLYRPQHALGAW